MKPSDLDSPDQVTRRGEVLEVELWYPGLDGHATTIEVGLTHVRAADSIQITFDFDRNGYSITQASRFMWIIGEGDEGNYADWQEVAFVPAWGRKETDEEEAARLGGGP